MNEPHNSSHDLSPSVWVCVCVCKCLRKKIKKGKGAAACKIGSLTVFFWRYPKYICFWVGFFNMKCARCIPLFHIFPCSFRQNYTCKKIRNVWIHNKKWRVVSEKKWELLSVHLWKWEKGCCSLFFFQWQCDSWWWWWNIGFFNEYIYFFVSRLDS